MARILLCVRGGAVELPPVIDALRLRGAEPVVLDPTQFPASVPVALGYESGAFHGAWAGAELGGISAVWQGIAVGRGLPEMAPGVRETCVSASERAVVGLLDSLQVFQLDPYWSQARADNKPAQLRAAQQLGLEIPATIVSNDPGAVRAFARRHRRVITKMLVQPAGGAGSGGEADVVFTTAMTDDDLARLDGLELCPMIFQEQIANRLDVRAIVVGRRIFAAALAAGRGADLDWRRHSYAIDRAPSWAPHELPGAVADRLLGLVARYGLHYGAADLIVRPDGSHVFLELNALGSFVFLGEPLTRAIAGAIAELLVDPAARRPAGGA